MIEYKTPQLTDIQTIRHYTEKSRTRNCEYAAANVFLWNDLDKLQFTIIDDVLVYRAINEEYAVYSPLEFPENIEHFIKQITEDALCRGKHLILNNLSESMVEQLEHAYVGQFDYGYSRDNSDYIYKVSEMITLSGSKFHGKKNHLNKFKKNYDYSYEIINENNIKECIAMTEQWRAEKNNEPESFDEELEILHRAFEMYDVFEFTGGLIRVNGEVKAFAFGEKVSEDTFVTHFEKAYEDIPGLYQIINQQFSEQSISQYTYVNREDDMGMEGLRKAKMSYNPVMMADKYTAKKLL